MSNLVCRNCKSISVEYEDYCGGTSYYRCKTCGQHGNKDKFTQQTVFHRITASPEVLADNLVYCAEPEHFCECADWRSVILGNVSFPTRSAAISATVAKLKEVE